MLQSAVQVRQEGLHLNLVMLKALLSPGVQGEGKKAEERDKERGRGTVKGRGGESTLGAQEGKGREQQAGELLA